MTKLIRTFELPLLEDEALRLLMEASQRTGHAQKNLSVNERQWLYEHYILAKCQVCSEDLKNHQT
jgi:hypothetical protein